MAPQPRVQSYRFAEGAPSPFPLRGPLPNRYVHQFAARALSLVFWLAALWFSSSVSRANKVMLTDVVAQALELCECQMIQGSVGPEPSASQSSPKVWGVNTVYDNVVGTLVVGLVVDAPGEKVSMLRVTLGGTAPGASEVHLAVPSDCCPRATRDGCLIAQAAVSERGRERVSKD